MLPFYQRKVWRNERNYEGLVKDGLLKVLKEHLHILRRAKLFFKRPVSKPGSVRLIK